MAGASGSGEDMETGRVNRAEGRTVLWAQVPPDVANFNGPAIFIVEVAKDAEDPDDFEDGATFIPGNRFDGILATGFSGGSSSNFGGTPGGTGVIGRGGRNQGTGILGVGGGTPDPGNGGGAGGIGVHGLGGPQADFFTDFAVAPGAGLVGQGGRQSDNNNRLRKPHAAGVIGIGGGTGPEHDDLPTHGLAETGGVGVYGQGADMSVSMVPPEDETGTIPGPDVPSGPIAAGIGVLGRGGIPGLPRDSAGPGVVGIAGGTPIPNFSEIRNSGIYGAGVTGVSGEGKVGVRGHSDSGTGVHGIAGTGRGGTFESTRSGQIRLMPQAVGVSFPSPVTVAATAIEGKEEGLKLPKDGRAGDLLALMDKQNRANLWFCVLGEGSAPAQWAQVLLGPPFDGTS